MKNHCSFLQIITLLLPFLCGSVAFAKTIEADVYLAAELTIQTLGTVAHKASPQCPATQPASPVVASAKSKNTSDGGESSGGTTHLDSTLVCSSDSPHNPACQKAILQNKARPAGP